MERTTEEIIEEFETLIEDDLVHEKDMMALVVGFRDETKFISSHDPDKLVKLNTMVEEGGSPIGYIRVERSGKEMAVEAKPLIEYAEEEQVTRYLEDLCRSAGILFVTGGRGVSNLPSTS